MHSSKTVLYKAVSSVIIWIVYFTIHRAFYPTIINEHALKQFSNTTESFIGLVVWQQIWNWLWVIPVVICVTIFWREIKSLFYKLGGF